VKKLLTAAPACMGRLLEPGNSSGYHKVATLLQNGDAKLMQKINVWNI